MQYSKHYKCSCTGIQQQINNKMLPPPPFLDTDNLYVTPFHVQMCYHFFSFFNCFRSIYHYVVYVRAVKHKHFRHLERSPLLLLYGIVYMVIRWTICELKRDLLYFLDICNNDDPNHNYQIIEESLILTTNASLHVL